MDRNNKSVSYGPVHAIQMEDLQDNQNTEKKEKPSKRKKFAYMRANSITTKYQQKKGTQNYQDELSEAVAKDDYVACKRVLEDDDFILLDINDDYNFHPLLLAARKGHSKILNLLLEYGASIEVTDFKGSNALHLATQQKCVNCCKILIEKGIDLSLKDRYDNLAIHWAAAEGLTEVLEIFLKEKGQKPNAKNKKGETPVHLSAGKGHLEALTMLLENKPLYGKWDLKDKSDKLPLHHAAYSGFDKCCKKLIDHAELERSTHVNKVDKQRQTPLILAASKGHSRCCEALVDGDPDKVDCKGNTALHYAAVKGFFKTVETLVKIFKPEIKANIKNKDNFKPIHLATIKNSKDSVKQLFEFDCTDPGLDANNLSLVGMAAKNSANSVLKYLLEQTIFLEQINYQDKDGKTPLHLAIGNKDTETIELLLEFKSHIRCDVKDNKGNLPLHTAAAKGLTDVCRLLMQGMNHPNVINETNVIGATPLHFAASNGSEDCCRYLYQKGAILKKDKDGFTPFHFAAREGKTLILKYFTKLQGTLLSEQVEISEDTSLHIAARNDRKETVEFLLNKMNKKLISKENSQHKTALDEAFENGNDKIFNSIISKVPTTEAIDKKRNFESTIHQYMHMALVSNRKVVQDAIVNSNYWFCGFSIEYCKQGRCENAKTLIDGNELLARKVFDKCIYHKADKMTYDFRIFEDFFYLDAEKEDSPMLRTYPFDTQSGKLNVTPDLRTFDENSTHLISHVVKRKDMGLLSHPIIKAYWRRKQQLYINKILSVLLLFEVITVLSLCSFMGMISNQDNVSGVYLNHTSEYNCSEEIKKSIIEEVVGEKEEWLISLRIVLFLLVIIMILAETNIFRKIQFQLDGQLLARILRMIGISLVIIPFNICPSTWALVIERWQWMSGIIVILVAWYLMIHAVNEIPALTTFMPITWKFLKSFCKVLMFIVLILFLYVFIFYLLFYNNPAFSSIWRSFIKSTVWVLGDLGYDDMFLSEENPIMYPILSNIIFLIFVTTIGGFIVNLIVTQPQEYLDAFRNDAAFHHLSSKMELMLKYDRIFHWISRKCCVNFYYESNGICIPLVIAEPQTPGGKEQQQSNLDSSEITMEQILNQMNELKKMIEEKMASS